MALERAVIDTHAIWQEPKLGVRDEIGRFCLGIMSAMGSKLKIIGGLSCNPVAQWAGRDRCCH